MRTLLKHGLLAASVAAVALACGSSNTNREPPAQAENNTQTTQSTYGAQSAQPQPSSGAQSTTSGSDVTANNDTTGNNDTSGSTFGSGGPQKPFYGPGLSSADDQAGSATTNQGTMNAKQVTNLSDGEILAIETAANTGEIQMAELARKQGKSAQVKDFASMMITHHRDAQTKAKAIEKKDKLTAKEDDTSQKLKSDVSSMMSDLRSKKGSDFDSSYIDDQVKAHRDVLDIVDNQLIPSVQSSDLKSHLTDVRKTVADHLQKAEDIQSKLAPVGAAETTSGTMKGKSTTGASKAKSGTSCDRAIDPDCDNDVHPAKSNKSKSGTDKSNTNKSGTDSSDTKSGNSGSQGQY
ncbi:MAG TPA: DUF4142 domain-containing protein [Labilithrix sp.]